MYLAATLPSSGEKRLCICVSASRSVSTARESASYSACIWSYCSRIQLRLLESTSGSPMADRRPFIPAICAERRSESALAAARARLRRAASEEPPEKSRSAMAASSSSLWLALACSYAARLSRSASSAPSSAANMASLPAKTVFMSSADAAWYLRSICRLSASASSAPRRSRA